MKNKRNKKQLKRQQQQQPTTTTTSNPKKKKKTKPQTFHQRSRNLKYQNNTSSAEASGSSGSERRERRLAFLRSTLEQKTRPQAPPLSTYTSTTTVLPTSTLTKSSEQTETDTFKDISHNRQTSVTGGSSSKSRLFPKTFLRHYNHNYSLAWFWRLLLLTLLCEMPVLSSADWLMDCGDCHCKWNSGKKTADCKNLTLSSVPENLSNEVQVLDLSFNRIVYLEENAFLTADLTNLHKLYIRNSSLQHIDPRTFTQLEILIELDLSNNLLKLLQANLFARLVKVRAIVLNGNLLEALGDGIFQNLKYLHKIELKDNRLVKIANQVFVNVPLLSQIYLNNNRLNFLRKESFENVKRLTALSLDGNPWNCTCELQIFRDFVLRRNLYTPPTACYYPAQLRGMLWIEDQPEAFACKPRIIFPAKGASITTSKENVTLVCRVHASANTHIAWDYNKQIYRSTSSGQATPQLQQPQQQRIFIQIIEDDQSKEKEFGRNVYISRLTILGADKTDEGTYTCIAENAGGKDSVQMTLLVEKPSGRELLQGNLAAVISLMALGLLSVSVFLAMVTCCIYKRFIASTAAHHRHHHLDLSGNDPLTSHGTVVANHGTTTVAGNTDVMLGVVNGLVVDNGGSNSSDTLKYKKHQQTTINGGSSIIKDKYTELLKQNGGSGGGGGGGVGGNGSDSMGTGNSPLMESISVSGGGGGGGVGGVGKKAESCDVQLGQLEKKYYEQHNNDDLLTIKYPHGRASAETNAAVVTGTTGHHSLSRSNDGLLNGSGTVDFQPDLLPSYASQKTKSMQHQNQQQDFMYSPVVTPGSTKTNSTTKTINSHEDQQPLHQFASSNSMTSATLPPPASQGGVGANNSRSKYNASAQDYLQNRFGSISRKQREKSQEKLSAGVVTSSLNLTRTSPVSEILSATRPSKSMFMPQRTVCSATTTATPTDTSSTYEYRQPPPPPYNATHRTTGNLLLTRRTSFNSHNDTNIEDSTRNSHTKDQGYRESGIAALYETTARQTIVTASPSMSFPTTITGFPNTATISPRRQLL